MRTIHLTASTFFGGPERQMLGLAEALPTDNTTLFASFSEHGRCQAFLQETRSRGFDSVEVLPDSPRRLLGAVGSVERLIRTFSADWLLCHGYKANLIGRLAARRSGVPAVAVSRGWTGENRKIRLYEAIDRRHLRLMDHVVAVSDGQAEKVRRCKVRADKLTVIRNSARLSAFESTTKPDRAELLRHFGSDTGLTGHGPILIAAGRLSPEKGFDILLQAFAKLRQLVPNARLVVFGEGNERPKLEQLRDHLDLKSAVALPGFTDNLDKLLPAADMLAISSYTEGLPNVGLEAASAGLPIVATAVGGNPEIIADGETGYLVPPGDVEQLADRLVRLASDPELCSRFGQAARQKMQREFTFAGQAEAYLALWQHLNRHPVRLAA